MELKGRWVCRECNGVCVDGEYLTAPSPFDKADSLVGCPHCLQVDTLEGCCQSGGCNKSQSSGTPNVAGFRYVWACWDHSPDRGLFEPDPALVDTP